MTAVFGEPRRHYRLCDSTNERARALAEEGAPSGTVVTAGEQSAGRGRRGRRWAAPAGTALLYSAILRPLTADHALLPLAVPLAVCDAVEAVAQVECAVKWPNDVWIDEHKVAGVLIEARPPDWAVIGIGINVAVAPGDFPRDLRWPATSVGYGVSVATVLDALNARLGERVGKEAASTLAEFRRRDALAGRSVTWEGVEPAGAGTAHGVDEEGNLIVRDESGTEHALGAGEVTLRVGS